jgi:2-iminobutanoate/2-iminopropanoate deaminase
MIRPVSTPDAPRAIGPYSQAVRTGNLVFISGQIPIDPETSALVDGGIDAQTHRVIQNIRAICEAAGGDLTRVVKTTIYLTDLGLFQSVNAVYASYFTDCPPARATVQVSALPLGALIEIDAVMAVSSDRTPL